MTSKACVYDIVLNGEVVYVGMTGNPEKRLASHRLSGVASEGSKMVVHRWYATREITFAAERGRQEQLRPYCVFRSPVDRAPFSMPWDGIRGHLSRISPPWSKAEIDEYIESTKSAKTRNDYVIIARKTEGYGQQAT